MSYTNRVRHLLKPNGTAVPFPAFHIEEPEPETALEERQLFQKLDIQVASGQIQSSQILINHFVSLHDALRFPQ